MKFVLHEHGETPKQVGAAVVRSMQGGDIALDLGPADGAPLWRLLISSEETQQLCDALSQVSRAGGESILILEG